MSAQRPRRLAVLDAPFLLHERRIPTLNASIGAVFEIEGPPPDADELRRYIAGRLERLPRFRQRVIDSPLRIGRPYWVDDPEFRLDYHVRSTAIGRGEEELRRFASALFSQRLDQSKPLWELWLVSGYADDRFALVYKAHHSQSDGASFVDIGYGLFEPRRDAPWGQPEPWSPSKPPSAARLTAAELADLGRVLRAKAGVGVRWLRRPRHSARRAWPILKALAYLVSALLPSRHRTPLNGPSGRHHELAWVRGDHERYRAIQWPLRATLNDVYLSVVAGALRRWLADRGCDPAETRVWAMVPVSRRHRRERGRLGNRLAAVRLRLPVAEPDPVRRVEVVRDRMTELKFSPQVVAAETFTRMNGALPAPLLARASTSEFSPNAFNLIPSSVKGVSFPGYMMGRELLAVLPIPFVPDRHAVATTIATYNGHADIGIVADRALMPDVTTFGAYLEAAFEELAAGYQPAVRPRGERTQRSSRSRTTASQRPTESATVE